LLSFLSPEVARFLIATVILWVLVYLGFSLHGIILQRRGLFGALWDSIRIAHVSLPYTVTLYTAIILLYQGLGLVWSIPAENSWLMLFGVIGHALVSTALVAATFAFYKDRYRWWVEMRQINWAQSKAKRNGANRKA
jgi:hypothetical protein